MERKGPGIRRSMSFSHGNVIRNRLIINIDNLKSGSRARLVSSNESVEWVISNQLQGWKFPKRPSLIETWEQFRVSAVLHLLRSDNILIKVGLYSQNYLHPPKIQLLPPPEVTRIRCLVNQDKKPRPLQHKPSFLQKLRGKDGGKKEEPLRNAQIHQLKLSAISVEAFWLV